MWKEYFDIAVGFLKEPSRSFGSAKKKNASEAFRFLLTLGLLMVVLQVIVQLVSVNYFGVDPDLYFVDYLANPSFSIIYSFVALYAFTIVFSIVGGLWLHLWVYIFGARKGLTETLKSVFYGQSPSFLLGWIPVVSFIAVIWSIVLSGMGLTKLQSMSSGRAAAVLIIAIAIPLTIGIILAIWLFLNFGAAILGSMAI